MDLDKTLGPELFEKFAGPIWGLRLWRAFFAIIVLSVVGGVALAGWHGTREIVHTYEVAAPSANSGTQKTMGDFQRQLDTSTDPTVRALLKGAYFTIPKGYPFAGEHAAVVPDRFVQIPHAGPCFNINGANFRSTGTSRCSGHDTGWNVGPRSRVQTENPEVSK